MTLIQWPEAAPDEDEFVGAPPQKPRGQAALLTRRHQAPGRQPSPSRSLSRSPSRTPSSPSQGRATPSAGISGTAAARRGPGRGESPAVPGSRRAVPAAVDVELSKRSAAGGDAVTPQSTVHRSLTRQHSGRRGSGKGGAGGVDLASDRFGTGFPDCLPAAAAASQVVSSMPSEGALSSCARCVQLRAELLSARALREEEHERQQLAAQCVRLAREDALSQLAVRRVSEDAAASLGAEVAAEEQLRYELASELAAIQSATAWKQEAQAASTELAGAEERHEEAKQHAEKCASSAQHAKRQHREFAKQSGTLNAESMREELEELSREKDELHAEEERIMPRLSRLSAEGNRLRKALAQESDRARQEQTSGQQEGNELAKVREQLRQMRHGKDEQLAGMGVELEKATSWKRAVLVELNGLTRQRLDEARRTRTAQAEKEELKGELQQLRNQLRWAEEALPSEEPGAGSRGGTAGDAGAGTGTSAGAGRSGAAPADASARPGERVSALASFQAAMQLAQERANHRQALSSQASEV
eukprot:CAMPEP_0204204110 /NCGR_PEP_ID=MMETSP0361-20130328/69390_1 /ASSEMBLY_ACC=CAM_ASM_000343 /TAXON_ID=268821 /ORGANISM="Scrippsiella Hangoei, Strain SHTV-5" /LENGTH=531 /DNA_ID=CAMNT_0051167161 /DNA_START=50 /DNA_END=1642 /DNA_ORIENTATION=-